MRAPNLNALRMFDAAARRLSFRAAAEELHLTQGAVAQQVRRLEADLGVRLFDRHARGLVLTADGRAYHGPVSAALAQIAEATSNLVGAPGRVTLSVPPSFAYKWVTPRLGALAAAHPEIDLRMIATETLTRFAEDGVDLAIRQGGPVDGAFVSRFLAPLDLLALATPHVAANLGDVEAVDGLGDAHLLQDGHGHWVRLGARGRIISFNQTALAIDAAQAGQGIVVAPRLLVAAELAEGRLVPLFSAPSDPSDGFRLLHPKRRLNPATQTVLAWIEAGFENAG